MFYFLSDVNTESVTVEKGPQLADEGKGILNTVFVPINGPS
jgi:hypothetical protein